MILNEVNGEVGMFYHYFNSKQEWFDMTIEHLMKKQNEYFSKINTDRLTFYEVINQILEFYQSSTLQFHKLVNGKVHWSILCSLHEITLSAMLPTVEDEEFNKLHQEEQNKIITELLCRVLQVSTNVFVKE